MTVTKMTDTFSGRGTDAELVALLILCQQLQSDKDGITRPDPRVAGVGAAETYDDFSHRIQQACVTVSQLSRLQQLESDLSTAGMALERQGCLQVGVGESYARAALNYLLAQIPTVTWQPGVGE